jgi:integrase
MLPQKRYEFHKTRAEREGIPFLLPYDEWLAIWRASGHFNETGAGGYCMARFGDRGPYAVDNVRIITQPENLAERVPRNAKVARRQPRNSPPNKRQITELTVRKARPKGKPFLIWDTKQRGLALRVQPTGAKSWVVVYNRFGRTRWLTLGAADAIYLSDARMLTAKAMLAVAEGRDPAADKKAERGAGTFADLAERYVETHAKRHNKSWKQADRLIRRYVLSRWGTLQASSITRGDVKAMLARIAGPILANQVLAAVSAIFTWAVKEELVAANPCRSIARNATRSRERVLSDSEMPKFWSAFDGIDATRAAALRMILLTGQRPGEIANMRREHIIDNWWTMPGEPVPGIWPGTKNAASHRVWLPQPVQKLIAALGDDKSGFVFAGPHGRAVRDLDQAMRMTCKKIAAGRATPHDLRRTFLTKVTGLAFGRDAMDRIANHKEKGKVTDIYDRFDYADDDQRIMEAVATEIMSLVEPTDTDANVIRRKFRR